MKKLLLIVACILTVTAVSSQEVENCKELNKTVRGPYETNRFLDNWFVGVGGGVNIYQGEFDREASFSSRLAPALDLTLGKWITPEYGVRLQYSGLKANGLASSNSIYARGADGASFDERFGVSNFHADFLWNWSNAFCGYRENRIWNASPFIGFGLAHSNGNGHTRNEFAPSVGLYNSFRLGRIVDLTLEARQMLVNQRFDGTIGGSRFEGMSSVTIGLSFKLGKSSFKRVKKVAPANYAPYETKIAGLESSCAKLTEQNEELSNENKELNDREPVETVAQVTASPVALFFEIGQSTLDKKELVNLEFYVKTAIKADKNKTFTLIGFADNATGSKKLNQRLSEKRMEFVFDLLVNKYGISADKLLKKAEGDTNNRYAEPKLNRVVIVE